jgi:hypothetical protein
MMKVVLRRRAMVLTGTAALGSILLSSSCAVAVASPVTGPAGSRDGWRMAITVPGTVALNTGLAGAGIGSVSCASPGDCTAVGTYATPPGYYHSEVFVVSQVHGTWRKAAELPGLAALDEGRDGQSGSVSCPSPGNCGTGGSYHNAAGRDEPFVANQVRGTWGKAMKVPGMAGLHAVSGWSGRVSCPSRGNCVAAGDYNTSIHQLRQQAFVVSQVHGVWGKALAVPGLAALNTGYIAVVDSISCPSPGNCTADGSYSNGKSSVQPFVVSEVNGTWGQAEQVPGIATLSPNDATPGELSCASPGNCTTIGSYIEDDGTNIPFVISQVNGTWGTAAQITGMTALNKFGAGYGYSVSCTSPGNCVAGGSEGLDNGFDVGGGGQPFIVTQTNGTWGDARLVAGIRRLNSGVDGTVDALSCPSLGNCTVAGTYGVGTPGERVYNLESFVANEINGTWHQAIEIPGTARLNSHQWGGVSDLSCAAPGRCTVGGGYTNSSNKGQAFVDSSS